MLSPITYRTYPLYRAPFTRKDSIPIALAQWDQVLLIIFLLGLLGLPRQGPPRQFHLGAVELAGANASELVEEPAAN